MFVAPERPEHLSLYMSLFQNAVLPRVNFGSCLLKLSCFVRVAFSTVGPLEASLFANDVSSQQIAACHC